MGNIWPKADDYDERSAHRHVWVRRDGPALISLCECGAEITVS